MANQLQTFCFEEHQIQSFNINNELFLRAIQLAEILGYKNPRDAISKHVDKEDVVKRDTLLTAVNKRFYTSAKVGCML